jgi:hypothetical protein
MPFRDIGEYHRSVVSKVATSGMDSLLLGLHQIKLSVDERYKDTGLIFAEQLIFPDNATLRVAERVNVTQIGEVVRLSYSFQYIRDNGYYFRYDKDPDAANPPHHAESHLHVIQEEPRYITHSTSFDEVFDFIVACFYT